MSNRLDKLNTTEILYESCHLIALSIALFVGVLNLNGEKYLVGGWFILEKVNFLDLNFEIVVSSL